MKDLKELMKNGVFGVMTDGKKFVVVDDAIVYDFGGFDLVDHFNEFRSDGYSVDKLFKGCISFQQLELALKDKNYKPMIFNRCEDVYTEMTIAEIEKKLGIKNLKIIKESK